MKNLLLSLVAIISNLQSLVSTTKDKALNSLYDECKDLYETLQFALQKSIDKGDTEEVTESKVKGIRNLIAIAEAKIIDAISGQLPNTIIEILKANHSALSAMIPTDGVTLVVTFNQDGSINVDRRKVKAAPSGDGTTRKSSGTEIFIINGQSFDNGNQAYKHLTTLFNGAEAFKQGTGLALRDGSASFSAPAQLRTIASKGIFKGITIETKTEAPDTTSEAPKTTPDTTSEAPATAPAKTTDKKSAK